MAAFALFIATLACVFEVYSAIKRHREHIKNQITYVQPDPKFVQIAVGGGVYPRDTFLCALDSHGFVWVYVPNNKYWCQLSEERIPGSFTWYAK